MFLYQLLSFIKKVLQLNKDIWYNVNMKNVGQVIKEIREKKGIKRIWVAQQSGMDVTYLYRLENGYIKNPSSETIQKVAKALQVSLDEIMRLAKEEEPKQEVTTINNKYIAVPIYGRIPAGTPREIWSDYMEDVIYIPDAPNGTFGLIVSGDSMVGEGIEEGDIALVNPNRQVFDKDIVVAVIDGSEFTLKSFILSNEHIILAPANNEYKPIVFTKEDFVERVNIIGVLIGVVKKFKRWKA